MGVGEHIDAYEIAEIDGWETGGWVEAETLLSKRISVVDGTKD